jgi:hypothetical protein
LNDTDYLKNIAAISEEIARLESARDDLKIPQRPLKSSESNYKSILEKNLQAKKTKVYDYVLDKYYVLKFGLIPEEIFNNTRDRVDKKLGEMVPDAVKKFVSAYENLKSTNPEDWSNAVHSCRRILKTVADVLYPPNTDGKTSIERNGRSVDIGPDNYINRLMIYIEDHSASERFRDIVGSHLKYMGERLDAIYEASSKGTHTDITKRSEAERYIIYTYLILGDILSL